MSRYTDPPWEIVIPEEHGAKGERFYIIRAADSTVAAVYPTGDVKETKANAYLIGAAVNLLEACAELLYSSGDIDSTGGTDQMRDRYLAARIRARAAIEKAKGAPPDRAEQSSEPSQPTEAKES
jgi:hypothetical protein